MNMLPSLPTCSVCIANFNGMAFIDNCIKSILNQSYGIGVEIIIHDDCSADGSAEYIKSTYPFIKLIQSQENVGFCVSNNRMAEASSGDFLLFLNNDAELFPDALETLYYYSKGLDHKAILGLPQYDAETKELIDIGSTFDPFLNPVPNKNLNRSDVGMIIGACLWISRKTWKAVGGFPEWFNTLAEDMYICCLAKIQGYKVEAIPESGFYHWVGRSIGGGKINNNKLSTSIGRRILSERNKSYVMFLCYPFPLFQFFFPMHILLLLIEGAILALVKKDANLFSAIYLSAIVSLLRNLRFLTSLRKKNQALRLISASCFFKSVNFIPYKLRMLTRYGMPEIK